MPRPSSSKPAAAVSVELFKPTVVGQWSKRELDNLDRGFVPRDVFRAAALVDDDGSSRLEAVRPVDWLKSFRCSPEASEDGRRSHPLTAQNQAILELLVTAARQQHPSMEYRVAHIPARALRKVVGSRTMLTVTNSMERLATVRCTLPGVHEPKRRLTARIRNLLYLSDNMAEVEDRLRKVVHDRVEVIDPTMRRRSAERDIRQIPISDFGDISQLYAKRRLRSEAAELVHAGKLDPARIPDYVDDHLFDGQPYGPPKPDPLLLFETRCPAAPDPDYWSAAPGVLRRFTPIVRWTIVEGVVYYELDRFLRYWLNSFRRSRTVWNTYVPIDVRQMAGFSSAYTAPLYRFLMASTYDAAKRNVTIGDTVVRIPLRDVPDLVGYRTGGGGLESQIRLKILAAVNRDLADMRERMSAQNGRVSISDGKIDAGDLVFTVSVPLDVGRMRSAKRWRMPDGELKKIVVKGRRDDLKPLRNDGPSSGVHHSVWLRIMNRLRIDRASILRLRRAWLLAHDEALHLDDPDYGRLTPGADTRLRRERLLAAVEAEGQSNTIFRFCCEELDSPDLSDPATLDVLATDLTEDFAKGDREAYRRHERYGLDLNLRERGRRKPADPKKLARMAEQRQLEDAQADYRHIQERRFMDEFRRRLGAERRGETVVAGRVPADPLMTFDEAIERDLVIVMLKNGAPEYAQSGPLDLVASHDLQSWIMDIPRSEILLGHYLESMRSIDPGNFYDLVVLETEKLDV